MCLICFISERVKKLLSSPEKQDRVFAISLLGRVEDIFLQLLIELQPSALECWMANTGAMLRCNLFASSGLGTALHGG
jgi:hypothetical protein